MSASYNFLLELVLMIITKVSLYNTGTPPLKRYLYHRLSHRQLSNRAYPAVRWAYVIFANGARIQARQTVSMHAKWSRRCRRRARYTQQPHTRHTHTAHTHTCSEFTVTAATVTVFAVFYNPFPFWPCTRQGKNKTKPAKRTQRNRQEEERSDIALSMCVCVFIWLCVSVCLARQWRPLPWRSLGASPVCHYVHASGLYFGRNFVYLRVLAAVAVAAQVPIRPKRPAITSLLPGNPQSL